MKAVEGWSRMISYDRDDVHLPPSTFVIHKCVIRINDQVHSTLRVLVLVQ